ncbi:GDSL-type esterase/lipase family protein [Priestia filamentosa]|uniref:GDSL-type esterase/lipase family protein n=1 Tax=Priestia filamentosa TaxID=1402861 RepID=UPI0039838C34
MSRFNPAGGNGSGVDKEAREAANQAKTTSETAIEQASQAKTEAEQAETKADKAIVGSTKKGRIACIGDSITAGQTAIRTYPNWLAKQYNLEVYNFGAGGTYISYRLDKMDEVYAVNPDIAIVLYGTNNMATTQTLADIIDEYKQLVDMLTSKGITPVLVTVLPRSDAGATTAMPKIYAFNDWLFEYARINGFIVVDAFTKFCNTDGTIKTGYLNTDKLHPEAAGYQVLVDAIYPKIPFKNTDRPWTFPGGPNAILTPTFSTDANGDGKADDWSVVTTTGVTATHSLVNHPTDGKWQQMARSGGVDVNSLSYYYQDLTLSLVAGDTWMIAGDIDVETIDGSCEVEVGVQWRTSTDTFISSLTALNRCPAKIVNKRWSNRGKVPANAAKVRVLLSVYGNGNCTVRFGRIMLKKLESL